jgi:hypothetical protein
MITAGAWHYFISHSPHPRALVGWFCMCIVVIVGNGRDAGAMTTKEGRLARLWPEVKQQ